MKDYQFWKEKSIRIIDYELLITISTVASDGKTQESHFQEVILGQTPLFSPMVSIDGLRFR
jgi:hypothetical protein